MKLFYYKEDTPNFGDDLNEWIWPKLLPNYFDNDDSHLVLGIGSILNDKVPKAEKYTVLGAGWAYGELPPVSKNWDIKCVRGRVSSQALGLPEETAIIDPAYLLSDFFSGEVKKKYKYSIIPHALSLEAGDWQSVCDALGIHLIDIRTKDTELFVNEVRASEHILCEAMHGAIVSDAFNIPWKGFYAYDHIHHEKWNDWLSVFDQKITLSKVNSLYKGYANASAPIIFKNNLKHLLIKLGFWKASWDLPIPKRTKNEEFDEICNSISLLIEEGNFSTTERSLVNSQLSKLRDVLRQLQTTTPSEKIS